MAPPSRPSSSSAKKQKQGTLFTFFSKKPAAKKDPPSSSLPSSNAASKNATNTTAASKKQPPKELWQQVTIGARVEVYWPDDKAYYAATVTGQRHSDVNKSFFTLNYDDGDVERTDLAQEQFRFLETKPSKNKKKRRIQEEFELEETASEASDQEESAYEQDAHESQDDEDDDDDQWMVTDDDDEVVTPMPAKTKAKKPTFAVTHVQSAKKPPAKKLKSSYTTPAKRSSQPTLPGSSKPTVTPLERRTSPTTTTTLSTQAGAPIPYVEKALNPAGAHVHNHFKFLQNPRDSQRRTKDDPNYDPHTLWVDYKEIEKHQKLTQAIRQWWDIKSKYADTVLLFKTGKFYEMHHMDADVGVNVLDFTYMKGHTAHAGFPEVSYGIMAERLVNAGYKVARVEQTETPAMLKQRKKNKVRGVPTPSVVNREVCSVLTRGTRTFCYMDDTNALSESGESNSTVGPLLAIREVLLESETMSDSNEEEDVQPVAEYGVTIVDAIRATVTIGQFADDVLRSRMNTLLAAFEPSEILIDGGENGASPVLRSLLRSVQTTSRQGMVIEGIQATEKFPKSDALNADARRKMERKSPTVHPWDVEETLEEVHRKGYYPRASRQQQEQQSTSRWPKVLQAAVEGKAELALSSFGAVLYYLQRNLIDQDILGMGIVKAYIPPSSSGTTKASSIPVMNTVVTQQEREEDGVELSQPATSETAQADPSPPVEFETDEAILQEQEINHMALDGTTLSNLEVLFNSQTHSVSGSLWSKIHFAKTPHGTRLLRAWLLRPLFRKNDIERRCDAVEELVSGAAAVAMEEARKELCQCGDIERLLSRVHSMGGPGGATAPEDSAARHHPNERAILYEGATHTKRKVGDFSKVLNYLQTVSRIPEKFSGVDIQSPLLQKLVRLIPDGGCFPDMVNDLDWFFENFDVKEAAAGRFEPFAGVDEAYDEACDAIERITRELADYKDEMVTNELQPASIARAKWKYINTMVDSKDKYLIELPASVRVPEDFVVKGKRGSGMNQVNKYRTPAVEQLVQQLERAYDVQREGRKRGMELIFAKFDSMRNLWAAAAQATALLDALGSLAQASSRPGFTRPTILDCPANGMPLIKVVQGRHPCVDTTHSGGDFIPNDLALGEGSERVLLLSGPNMGGKSTLLRQTCLITILAQIGCFVPADECALTPVDRIYTRLGASDRILQGQSTFFIELAETAAALRGATRRSLVIMDELGRGTSTFDGCSIASAAVKHLVERNRCLTLFATHYHSVLDEWEDEPSVRLGHMECLVEGSDPVAADAGDGDAVMETEDENEHNITFMYTLGTGKCPKSFGINVARLAGLAEPLLAKAKEVSESFEAELNGSEPNETDTPLSERITNAIQSGSIQEAEAIWRSLQ